MPRTSIRTASCRCGRLRAHCSGDPVRVSICHCLECQRRTGSAFAAQARWPTRQVTIEGEARSWVRVAESGNTVDYRFCATCGSTVFYTSDVSPGVVAVPIGAFADPDFPSPRVSVYEKRKHHWVDVVGDIGHFPESD